MTTTPALLVCACGGWAEIDPVTFNRAPEWFTAHVNCAWHRLIPPALLAHDTIRVQRAAELILAESRR